MVMRHEIGQNRGKESRTDRWTVVKKSTGEEVRGIRQICHSVITTLQTQRKKSKNSAGVSTFSHQM